MCIYIYITFEKRGPFKMDLEAVYPKAGLSQVALALFGAVA